MAEIEAIAQQSPKRRWTSHLWVVDAAGAAAVVGYVLWSVLMTILAEITPMALQAIAHRSIISYA